MTARAHVTLRGERHDLGAYSSRAVAAEVARRARIRLGTARPRDRWGRVAITRADMTALNARIAEITGRRTKGNP